MKMMLIKGLGEEEKKLDKNNSILIQQIIYYLEVFYII